MTPKWMMLFAAASMAAVPAGAQMISAKDPKTIVGFLQENGYAARLDQTQGEPSIKSGTGGIQFTIFFNNCKGGADCTTVSFVTGFTDVDNVPLSTINTWNQKNRFARAYIDSEGDPVLMMDIDLDHEGIARANFGEYLNIWSSLTPKYLAFLRSGGKK